MKIMHLMAPGPIAGAERVVVAGCRALRAAGVDLEILVVIEARRPELGRAFVELAEAQSIPCRTFTVASRISPGLARLVRHTRADIWHCHGYKTCAHALASGVDRRRMAATFHGYTSHDSTARVYEFIDRMLLRCMGRVFAVSDGAREVLVRRGLPSAQVEVIENMLSDLRFAAIEPAQCTGARPKLMYAGRLSPEKGLDTLLRALARVPEIDLTVVGDGAQRSQLESLAAELALSDRVDFVGFQSDVVPVLAQHEALLLPSLREGLPMVVVESLAAARPVLASSVGSLPQLIADGRTGLLAPPENVDAWIGLLRRYIELRGTLSAGVAAQRSATLERFSPQRWAQQTRVSYEKMLAELG